MVYLLGKKISDNLLLKKGLIKIYGIGNSNAEKICKYLGFLNRIRVKDLTQKNWSDILKYIRKKKLRIEKDLKKKLKFNISNLINIRNYKGFRHYKGLSVRGQRTHSNAKTQKKLYNSRNFQRRFSTNPLILSFLNNDNLNINKSFFSNWKFTKKKWSSSFFTCFIKYSNKLTLLNKINIQKKIKIKKKLKNYTFFKYISLKRNINYEKNILKYLNNKKIKINNELFEIKKKKNYKKKFKSYEHYLIFLLNKRKLVKLQKQKINNEMIKNLEISINFLLNKKKKKINFSVNILTNLLKNLNKKKKLLTKDKYKKISHRRFLIKKKIKKINLNKSFSNRIFYNYQKKVGNLFINIRYNNFFIFVYDVSGNLVSWASGGSLNLKGKQQASRYAAKVVIDLIFLRLKELKINYLNLIIKGKGPARKAAIFNIRKKKNFKILNISDFTPIPFNGCRLKKFKR